MIDAEVERLRHLRETALRTRAIARTLCGEVGNDTALLERTACIAWRVARTATGRLRAHPHIGFQREASVGVLLSNAISARLARWRARSQALALRCVGHELAALQRELSDARALTWAGDLSDLLGRSGAEIDSLLRAFDAELRIPAARIVTPVLEAAHVTAPKDGDWPYLAI